MIYELIASNTILKASIGTIFLPIDDFTADNLFKSLLQTIKSITLIRSLSLMIVGVKLKVKWKGKFTNRIRILVEVIHYNVWCGMLLNREPVFQWSMKCKYGLPLIRVRLHFKTAWKMRQWNTRRPTTVYLIQLIELADIGAWKRRDRKMFTRFGGKTQRFNVIGRRKTPTW